MPFNDLEDFKTHTHLQCLDCKKTELFFTPEKMFELGWRMTQHSYPCWLCPVHATDLRWIEVVAPTYYWAKNNILPNHTPS